MRSGRGATDLAGIVARPVQLRDAPTIVGRLDRMPHTLRVIDRAARRIRREYDSAPCDTGLRRIAGDIWALDKPVGLHTDITEKGSRVFGCVLINDPGLVLFAENVIYDLPVGTIYHINGHRRHGALAHNRVQFGQLFAFLAWDMPADFDIEILRGDLVPSLEAFGDYRERVYVPA